MAELVKEDPPPYEEICDDITSTQRHTHNEANATVEYPNRYSRRVESRYEYNPDVVYNTSGSRRHDSSDVYGRSYHQIASPIAGSYEGPSHDLYTYGHTRSTAGPSYRQHDPVARLSKVSLDDVVPSTRRSLNRSRSGSSDSSDDSSSDDESDTSDDEDRVIEAWHLYVHRPRPLDVLLRLRRPIALPQVMSGVGAPFCRAYPLELASYGISCEKFLEFVDKLNVVSAAHPPLYVLGTIGGVVAFVPSAWSSIAGRRRRHRARRGSSESFMQLANAELFEPRNLRVQLCNTQAVGAMLGLPREELSFVPFNQYAFERHLSRFGKIGQLTFQVPPPGPQARTLEILSKRQVERQLRRSEKRLAKRRDRALKRMYGKHGKCHKKYEKEMRRLTKDMDKTNRKAERENWKAHGTTCCGRSREQDKDLRKLSKHMNRLELKAENAIYEYEVNSFDEVLWIVVTALQ
ncbi:hypothetical protein V1509DRAFT_651662 [Lipomyces kononenkoae]